MSTNIEMNVMNTNGQYQVVYPQTIVENIVDLQTTLNNYYTKEQSLGEIVKSLYSLDNDSIPNDVLIKINDLINQLQNEINNIHKIYQGTYIGVGQAGSYSKNSYVLNFYPKIVIITGGQNPTANAMLASTIIIFTTLNIGIAYATSNDVQDGTGYSCTCYFVGFSISGNTISWYSQNTSAQCNKSNYRYSIFAIG